MNVRLKGVYSVTRALANGRERTYYYHRATGARLPDDPDSEEFLQAVLALNKRGKPAPAERSFKHLFQRYRDPTAYTELRESTRKEYDRHIRYIEPVRSLSSG